MKIKTIIIMFTFLSIHIRISMCTIYVTTIYVVHSCNIYLQYIFVKGKKRCQLQMYRMTFFSWFIFLYFWTFSRWFKFFLNYSTFYFCLILSFDFWIFLYWLMFSFNFWIPYCFVILFLDSLLSNFYVPSNPYLQQQVSVPHN